MVIALIAILAALLLPALSTAQSQGKRAACLNNLKQLAISSQLYCADNEGKLAENLPQGAGTNSWVLGNMKSNTDATNFWLIRQGKFYPYASQVATFHCPADLSQTSGRPRIRSYSMNGWVGSRYMDSETHTNGFRTFLRESEIAMARPSQLWMMADEHEASIDDGFFLVTMDDTRPFASYPAVRHSRAYALNFADAHAEVYKLRDPEVLMTESGTSQINPKNPDWQRLKAATTVR